MMHIPMIWPPFCSPAKVGGKQTSLRIHPFIRQKGNVLRRAEIFCEINQRQQRFAGPSMPRFQPEILPGHDGVTGESQWPIMEYRRTARAARRTCKVQNRDLTCTGNGGQAFLTTHWSLIGEIQSDQDGDRALVGLLLERYWKPVYFYLRRSGRTHDEAEDLTQGFFHEVVLNRDLVQRADQSKGRFRTFLLHALKQYLIDEYHKCTARKRIPEDKLVSLNLTPLPALPAAVEASSPQESYDYGWMASLLDQVLSQVERRCAEEQRNLHWQLFHDRIVRPILDNTDPPSLGEMCQRYHIADKKKASNMIITVKRCFKTMLWEHVRNTVSAEDETEEELGEIMRLFGKSAQHL